jgi:hypothetical protein
MSKAMLYSTYMGENGTLIKRISPNLEMRIYRS